MFTRALALPAPGEATFFLRGARQVGKSTLLWTSYPDALWIDLLRTDVGVVNVLAHRHQIEPRSPSYGKAFENLLHHELVSYESYARRRAALSYWRLTTGVEVDFIVGDLDVAIECKGMDRVRPDELRGLRELRKEHPKLRRALVVSHEPRVRKTDDGIEILPFGVFVERLWGGEIF